MTDDEWIKFVDSIVVEIDAPVPKEVRSMFQRHPAEAWKKTVQFTLEMVVKRMKEKVRTSDK